jgi:hypothetical protein
VQGFSARCIHMAVSRKRTSSSYQSWKRFGSMDFHFDLVPPDAATRYYCIPLALNPGLPLAVSVTYHHRVTSGPYPNQFSCHMCNKLRPGKSRPPTIFTTTPSSLEEEEEEEDVTEKIVPVGSCSWFPASAWLDDGCTVSVDLGILGCLACLR